MSYNLRPNIVCDQCGHRYEPGYENVPSLDGKTRHNAEKFRAALAELGWISRPAKPGDGYKPHRGRRDFCPECRHKKLRGERQGKPGVSRGFIRGKA
jgi:hypothetical protein